MVKRYTPEKFNVVSTADEIGALLDISRIVGEDLYAYKKRVLDSSKNPANSTYQGLINAINRDLGLERKEILEVSLKSIGCAFGTDTDVSIVNDTMVDSRSFTGAIDGVDTVAVGDTLTTTISSWVSNELTGMVIQIDGLKYKVLSNTESKIVFDGQVSNVVGQNYQVFPDWADNELVGLAVVTDLNRFRIIANSSNVIQVDSSLFERELITKWSIQANSPRIEINSSKILLYKDYINEENYQLDIEIGLRDKGKEHHEIIDEINSSRFFKAGNLLGHGDTCPAFTIKQQDSDVKVVREIVPPSKFFRLQNKLIKEGSMQFSRTDVFGRETREIDSVPTGPYYMVNYKEGVVKAKSIGTGRNTVTYTYMDIPFRIETAPAVVTPLTGKSSEDFLFTQKEKRLYDDVRDKMMSGQPRSDMIENIAELLAISKQTWGN